MELVEQFVQALLQLGYDYFDRLKTALDKGERRKAKSVWGKLAMIIYGKNKDIKRNSLSMKWNLNRGSFQDMVKKRIQENNRKSISFSDIPSLAVEHISNRLDTARFYDNSLEFSRVSFSDLDFSVHSLEQELMDDKLLGFLASGCDEPEVCCLPIRLASSPPHTGASDTHHWTYANYDHRLWLDAVKFFGLDCPSHCDEFVLVSHELYTEFRKFSDVMVEIFDYVRLVKRSSCLINA